MEIIDWQWDEKVSDCVDGFCNAEPSGIIGSTHIVQNAVIAGFISLLSEFIAGKLMEIGHDEVHDADANKISEAEALLWSVFERSRANANALYESWKSGINLEDDLTTERAIELFVGFIPLWNEQGPDDRAAAEDAQDMIGKYFQA